MERIKIGLLKMAASIETGNVVNSVAVKTPSK